jgi:hypothetical protein
MINVNEIILSIRIKYKDKIMYIYSHCDVRINNNFLNKIKN